VPATLTVDPPRFRAHLQESCCPHTTSSPDAAVVDVERERAAAGEKGRQPQHRTWGTWARRPHSLPHQPDLDQPGCDGRDRERAHSGRPGFLLCVAGHVARAARSGPPGHVRRDPAVLFGSLAADAGTRHRAGGRDGDEGTAARRHGSSSHERRQVSHLSNAASASFSRDLFWGLSPAGKSAGGCPGGFRCRGPGYARARSAAVLFWIHARARANDGTATTTSDPPVRAGRQRGHQLMIPAASGRRELVVLTIC
jgi:hypothetical protein